LVASSATTGAELWSTPLPARPGTGRSYVFGQAISGNLVVVPYTGWHESGGLVAVNRSTRTIAWTASRPAASPPAGDNTVGGPVVVDGGRAYLQAGEDAVVAYRLSDGALLWQDLRPDYVTGVAAANGQVVTTSDDGGLVVYDGATARACGPRPWATGPR
jgi:outer membrane protein assembly factor BamB